MQVFECFGRLGSVSAAAKELGVTSGAISQQLKILEDYLEMPLIMKDGRRASLTPTGNSYHNALELAFEKLDTAQHLLSHQMVHEEVHISGLPTMLLKWLNPRLHKFQALHQDITIRIVATQIEPDLLFFDQMFRLTYGDLSEKYAHSRVLFRDECFPVCSPCFLEKYPIARDECNLGQLPWVDIDWGPAYASVPRLRDWLREYGVADDLQNALSVHSISSSALESVANGQGIVLAQSSLVATDIELGRLVRLSEKSIPLPESYFICWGETTLQHTKAREFLNWLLADTR
ncbi:LysR substrate-binding domain-containing protein [Rhodophyticola sp. CCM32]|uniref:LysR substrate-binding domain-containing protein n=1 Tax=Rhodophyticola sp. CCM32 TaxID=2916397 RepID=UPI00143D3F6C|nr:LysR substrate-binding domain-containing protein [Rhodophyticola sp. CCM32]